MLPVRLARHRRVRAELPEAKAVGLHLLLALRELTLHLHPLQRRVPERVRDGHPLRVALQLVPVLALPAAVVCVRARAYVSANQRSPLPLRLPVNLVVVAPVPGLPRHLLRLLRSEERRVGKEC